MKDPCNKCGDEEKAQASAWCRTCQREYAKGYRAKNGKRKKQHRMLEQKPTLKVQPKGTHRLKAVFVW